MLETIRSRSSGIFAWFVAILIIVTMAFFGVSSYVSEGVNPVIFEQGDEKIVQSQYRGFLQQAQRRAIAQNAGVDVSSDAFKDSVLRQLISQSLLRSMSNEAGYVAADESVAKLILENSAFKVDGKFDQLTYDRFVAGNFGSKQQYEQLLKNNLQAQQLSSGLLDSAIEINNGKDSILALASEKREFDLIRYSVDDLVNSVSVSDQELQAFYDDNINQYQDPEKISVRYLTLSAKAFEKDIQLSEDDLRVVYEELQEQFTTDETRELRHILFTGADAESQANETLEQLRSGSSFEELAEKLSQDAGSAQLGGSLGDVPRGQMVEPFENAAFALPLNTVSEPVSTEFGYHLIEVTAINGGESQSFEEVKDSIEKDEIKRQSEDIFFEKAEILRNAVFENSDTLQIAAEDLGLTVETSGFFTRNEGEGFFNNPSIRSSAFSDAVLVDNQNSEVIDVTPTELIVLRKDKYLEKQATPFEQVKEQVESSLKRQLATEKVAEKIDSDYQTIIDSGDWAQTIDSLGLTAEPTSMSYIDQSDSTPFGIASTVFSSSTSNFESSIGKVVDVNGDGYLFKLNSITEGNPASLDQEIIDLINSDIAARTSSSITQSYMQKKVQQAIDIIDKDLL